MIRCRQEIRGIFLNQYEVIIKSLIEYLAAYRLAPEILEIVRNVVSGIVELAVRTSNSNMDYTINRP